MLAPETPTDQFAQSGYHKTGDGNTSAVIPSGKRIFAEASKACYPSCGGASPVLAMWTSSPPSGALTYSIYLRAADDRIHMYYGSTSLLTMNRDVTGEWSSAWGGLFQEETRNVQSDVPGLPGDHTLYSSIQKYDSSGNISDITSLSGGSEWGNYHVAINDLAGGAHSLEIWTAGQ